MHDGVLLLCTLFLTSKTPTTFSHPLNVDIYRVHPCFGLNVRVSQITQLPNSLLEHVGLGYGLCVPRHGCFHISSVSCPTRLRLRFIDFIDPDRAIQGPVYQLLKEFTVPKTTFWAQRVSNGLDFAVNHAQIQAWVPSVKAPLVTCTGPLPSPLPLCH